MTDILTLIRSWDREDVHDLKALLEEARDDPAVIDDDFDAVRVEIQDKYAHSTLETDHILHLYGVASLVAIDTHWGGLIAQCGGSSSLKYDAYEVHELLTPDEKLDAQLLTADDKIGDHHYADYSKLAEGLHLIATAIDRGMIKDRAGLEKTLTLLNAAKDRLRSRVLFDIYREKYGPGEEGLLSRIREWDGQDINHLKEMMEDARDDPEISDKSFIAVRREIVPIFTMGARQDFLNHPSIMASDECIAVDVPGRALIAEPNGTGLYEEYRVKEGCFR